MFQSKSPGDGSLKNGPIRSGVWNSLLLILGTFFVPGFSGQALSVQEDSQSELSPADIEFFENKIRPILAEHCLQCHGDDDKKVRGGLRLTSRVEILKGGDSGPAIVPGKPAESLLIGSVRYEDFEMPPKGQLPRSQIATLEKWVEMGAPDPRKTSSAIASHEIDIESGKRFWSFSPRSDPQPPITVNQSWPESSIDQFILARLESEGMAPVADADRETLIRRAYVALIGLPPTVRQIDDFLNDENDLKTAFATVVDDLLDTDHFGERWGRHWLDVARFAESSGGGRSLMFPEAWRFRDYVIASFNDDKPIDQFIKEQIAGDLLPYDTHAQKIEQLVAAGFLTLGPTNYEQQDKQLLAMEVVDEQVDTVGRAFLGMTLGCARCHDHKFDPIPMTDYYALAGIFSSTDSLVDGNVSTYVTQPLATEQEVAAEKAYREQVTKLSKRLASAKRARDKLTGGKNQTKPRVESQRSSDLEGIVIDDRSAKVVGVWTESTSLQPFVDGHYLHDQNTGKGKKQVEFSPQLKMGGYYEVRLAYSASGNRASNVPVVIGHQDGQAKVIVNQSQPPPINGLFISLGTFRFEADNQSSVVISNDGTDGHVIVDAVQFLLQDPDRKQPENGLNPDSVQSPEVATKQVPDSGKSPSSSHRLEKIQHQIEMLDKQLRTLKKNGPPSVAVAMSVRDGKNPADGHLHIRGSVRNLGPIVPRGFISVCSQNPKPKIQANQSGRLQLANWIADDDHPLTARVYVNRVWRHLFGQGLVSTIDNFGFVGQKPTHPELLDHLANEFVGNGWSTKQLIRKIMASHVYRLSCKIDPAYQVKDDLNRLLWRANRRRVDAEVLRDSILFVSGDLDLDVGGLTIRKISQYDLGYEFDSVRRSVYVPAFRNSMLDLFEVFDFANPNVVTGDRNTSTLPTQALFLMNNPMVMRQSRRAAMKFLATESSDQRSRIELAYRQALGRKPNPIEVRKAVDYLQATQLDSDEDDPELAAWSSFFHALFGSLDFRFVE